MTGRDLLKIVTHGNHRTTGNIVAGGVVRWSQRPPRAIAPHPWLVAFINRITRHRPAHRQHKASE